jgi:hypothetical protein
MPCSPLDVNFQCTTWGYIPEERTLHYHCCENLKSYKILKDLHIFRTPEYKYIVHMGKCCYIDGISPTILMDLHFFCPTEYEIVVFGCYLHVCMCIFLVPEQLNRFYLYLVFKSLFVIHQWPVYMDILVPEVGALCISLKNKINFLKKVPKILMIKCKLFMKTTP